MHAHKNRDLDGKAGVSFTHKGPDSGSPLDARPLGALRLKNWYKDRRKLYQSGVGALLILVSNSALDH